MPKPFIKSDYSEKPGVKFLFAMHNTAEKYNNKPMKDHLKIIYKWFGVEKWEDLQDKHFELFSRGYIYRNWEGNGPGHTKEFTLACRNDFPTFSSIEKYLSEVGMKMTPEIRCFYDRLFVFDTEIEIAIKENGYNFESPKGLTTEEIGRINRKAFEARLEGISWILLLGSFGLAVVSLFDLDLDYSRAHMAHNLLAWSIILLGIWIFSRFWPQKENWKHLFLVPATVFVFDSLLVNNYDNGFSRMFWGIVSFYSWACSSVWRDTEKWTFLIFAISGVFLVLSLMTTYQSGYAPWQMLAWSLISFELWILFLLFFEIKAPENG